MFLCFIGLCLISPDVYIILKWLKMDKMTTRNEERIQMCTAITYYTKDHYFGRNLDLEFSYNETVTVTPRYYPFHLRNGKTLDHH